MEEEKDPSTNYIKGFNYGYTLSKHEPELLKKLISSEKEESEQIKAIKAGSKQYEIEKMRDQINLSKTQSKNIDRER